MDSSRTTRSDGRAIDGLVVFWLVLWVVVGGWVGYSIWDLAAVGDTITSSGQTLHSAGEALRSIGGVPVVGDRAAELGSEVQGNGASIAARGQEIEAGLRRLAVLLGISVAVVPSAPVLLWFVERRRRPERQAA